MGFILEPEEMKFRLKPRIFAITKITISTARMNCLPVNFSPLRCWNGLIDKISQNANVCIFERQETIYFFVYRSLYLSDAPKTEDIDQTIFGI